MDQDEEFEAGEDIDEEEGEMWTLQELRLYMS